MFKTLVAALSIISSFWYCVDSRVTVYIIGDSTAANKQPGTFPETGWGMELKSFFNPNITVDNRALNGRSTKSFLNEKKWDAVLAKLKAGDYVLIQFGHNDEKIDRPEVGTSLSEYKNNLIRYVKETQAKKAHPVLLTPIARHSFTNGVFKDTHQGYPDVVRSLADSLAIPLIDMHRKTGDLLVSLGDSASTKFFNYVDSGHVNYPTGKKDNTHLNPEGAKTVASLVVEGIREKRIGLAKYLIK